MFGPYDQFESFHVLAKRIRRRTLWLQDAAKQLGGSKSPRPSVVDHIVDATKADLSKLRVLWQYASPNEQAQRYNEYRELSEMLHVGLNCISMAIKGDTEPQNDHYVQMPNDADDKPAAEMPGNSDEKTQILREVLSGLMGLHELTTEIARGVATGKDDLFAMEENAKATLLNAEKAKSNLFTSHSRHSRNLLLAAIGVACVVIFLWAMLQNF